VAVIVNCWN